MYGNGGDDILIGGAGKDELWGGAGSDTFVFRFPDATSTDRVKDFSATDHDHIGIYASDYGLSLGHGLVDDGTGKLVLDPAYFVAVAGSASFVQGTSSGHGQFVFSSTSSTRTLMWDADGAGPLHGVALATFNSGVALSAADFFVFNAPPTVTVNGSPDPVPERADAHVAFTIDLSAPMERGRASDLLDDGRHGRGRQRLCRRLAWPGDDRRRQHQRHRLDRCARR